MELQSCATRLPAYVPTWMMTSSPTTAPTPTVLLPQTWARAPMVTWPQSCTPRETDTADTLESMRAPLPMLTSSKSSTAPSPRRAPLPVPAVSKAYSLLSSYYLYLTCRDKGCHGGAASRALRAHAINRMRCRSRIQAADTTASAQANTPETPTACTSSRSACTAAPPTGGQTWSTKSHAGRAPADQAAAT